MISEQDWDAIMVHIKKREPLPLAETKKLLDEMLRLYKLLDKLHDSIDLIEKQMTALSEANRRVSLMLGMIPQKEGAR